MLYVNDSSKVWHVAKTGSDSNSGHAGQYPVNLVNDAKLTIQAVVNAANSGDTIIVWPGDYDENVALTGKALTLAGTSRNKSRIIMTTGKGIALDSNCIIRNLAVESLQISDNGIGIYAWGKSNLLIESCDIYGAYDGINVYGCSDVVVRDCRVRGKYDGGNFAGVERLLVEDCLFSTDGTYGTGYPSRALWMGGAKGVVRSSVFYAARNDTSQQSVGGVDMSGVSLLSFLNCVFYATGGNNVTGGCFGIYANNANAYVSLADCAFYKNAPAVPAASKYDIWIPAGTCVVGNCAYSNVMGAIKVLDTISPVDSLGRVDLGRIKGDDAVVLEKAVKMLTNKAVQNKLTGEINYYDDDGQTVILTHTPSDGESSITRMPS